MIDVALAVADGPSLTWPEHCAVSPRVRAEIEVAHSSPLRQRADQIDQLRDEIEELRTRVRLLEEVIGPDGSKRLVRLERAHKRLTLRLFGGTVDEAQAVGFRLDGVPANGRIVGLKDGLIDVMADILFGKDIPADDDARADYVPNIIKLIRAYSHDTLCAHKVLRDCGDWQIERAYQPGMLVHHDGAWWLCQTGHTGLEPAHGNVWRRAPGVYWRGVWDESVQYHRGDSVICSGSSFVCKQDTTEKPGTGEAWAMAAKRGRNARDVTREQRAAVLK